MQFKSSAPMKTIIRITFFALLSIIVSCTKDSSTPTITETGSVTDIDGNSYKTIKIGGKWWMAENLNVKSYNDGTPIEQAQNDADWIDSVPLFCRYNNNSSAPGLLYNWYAIANQKKIAPAGWHIPTDDEWKQLEQAIGMDAASTSKAGWRGSNEGLKMKIDGGKGWSLYADLWPTNESGFTALAGSCRLPDGTYGNPGLFATGFWWTSTADDQNSEAWFRYLDYKNPNVYRSHTYKGYGFSIRCVKD